VSNSHPIYEVYALRYATQEGRRSAENYLGHDPHGNAPVPFDFYFWVIRNGTHTVVVDTGCKRRTAQLRKRTYLAEPTVLLGRLGIDAADVTDVVITHMHYDHAGNMGDFPRARIHIQETEMGFCTGRCMCHGALRAPFEVEDVVQAVHRLFDGKMNLLDGDAELLPGITLHHMGGHTLGLQVVRVATARGHVVLASDAAHYWENLRERRPFPIVESVPDMLEAHGKIESLADGPTHVIPGHDPLVRMVFPSFAGDPDIVALHELPSAATGTVGGADEAHEALSGFSLAGA
jgi:glyoxylase-like metal-dependent hydrolase (beta-lactamase superfamily II)